jgi:hypothetical protein
MKRWAPVFLVGFLTACGGGGGGSGTSSTNPSYAPTVPQATAPPLPAQSVQRAIVQQSLSSTQQSSTIASYGSASGSTALGVARRVAQGERLVQSTSPCTNGVIVATAPGPSSNVELLTVTGFYNTATCTEPLITFSLTVTQTGIGAGTAVGNATTFSTSGSVTEYDNLNLTLVGAGTGSGYFSLRDDVSPNATSAPVANLGIGCGIAATSDTCSLAAALHLASLSSDDAAAATVTGIVSTTPTGYTNVALTGSGNSATGGLNATNVTQSGNYLWAITGGTAVDSASVSGALQYTAAGTVVGGNLTLTDAADNATATLAYNSTSQTLSGSITQTSTGATVATYSVSVVGTGTVTYSNGSVGTITNWVVQS